MMKRALAVVLAAGFAVGSYATDARVAVMGRQGTPWFYRDEITVFNNPADMSLYPNLIYGSFGWIDPTVTNSQFTYENTIPNDPFFGGLFSYRFSDEDNGPMLSIGAFANRRDYMLEELLAAGGPRYDELGLKAGYLLAEPLGKFDVMAGYDLGNGLALGVGTYIAVQTEKAAGNIINQTRLLKGTIGLNHNIDQGLDLEISANVGYIDAGYTNTVNNEYVTISDGELFLRVDGRFFSAVHSINGSFVPQASVTFKNLAERSITDLTGGLGMNMNIDRGFFWAGIQGIAKMESDNTPSGSDSMTIGGRVSFGIERNIVWDWFLIRVGGQKEFKFAKTGAGTSEETKWLENPSGDGTDGDLVGLGFGVNIDNRLRIDVVVSEALPYTFTNMISGAQHHLFNRVSATYRF